MAASTRRSKSVRSRSKSARPARKLVDYRWEGQSYVLDLKADRVYRDWMAVETNKGFTILGAYRSEQALSA